MPELPEAETIARRLDRELSGRTLGEVHLNRPDVVHGNPTPLCELLPNRRVRRVRRRAKRIVFELSRDQGLVFHLGMSGRLTITEVDEPIEDHTHLRIRIKGVGRELRFRDPRRFGGVWVLPGTDHPAGRKLGPVGPEPLELSAGRFCGLLQRSRRIKALLLDQRIIAGLGNIYCDEALHTAGVHPMARADNLDDETARALLRAVKATLRKAIRHGGSTLVDYRSADGQPGSFQKLHRVYGREGKPCSTCRTRIERIEVAGRSTFICPTCQTRERITNEPG